MIHTARQSPKFVRLVRSLRAHVQPGCIVDAESIATGVLERLWHATISGAMRGDIGRFDNEVIAEMCGWLGDADTLIEMLVACGFVDECEEHRLIVHDWHEHAPRHVKGNVTRLGGFLTIKDRPLGTIPNGPSPRDTPLATGVPNLTKPNQTKPNNTPYKSPKGDGVAVQEFFDRWNRFAAKRPKLAECRKLSKPRRDKIAARLKDAGWFSDFCEAILNLPLGGDGWQPTLDWLIRNDHNIYLLMEGAFDWRHKDDPAATRLAQQRRKEAFKQREAFEAAEKAKRHSERPGTQKAIGDILPLPTGEQQETGGGSLLFGLENDSSASGAEPSSRQLSGKTGT